MPVLSRRNRRLAAALVALVPLSACTGGGTGAANPGPTTTSAPPGATALRVPIAYDTSEYRTSTALDRIGAGAAYAHGVTGLGRTVAVIDSGIRATDPEFAGALHPASADMVAARAGAPLADERGHGTGVAAVIGARRNDTKTHGVAFDARIMALRTDAAGADGRSTGLHYQSDLAAATRRATAHGADVLNFSLGGVAPAGDLSSALAGAARAGAVLVAAAGNGGDAEPAGLGLWFASPAAQGAGVVVGSVDANGTISDFSNRAGSARQFYLVAPGELIRAIDAQGRSALWSGTSFAAPHVSGAAALLREAFPNLTGAQIVDILLRSATDLGEPGTDAVYGRGMLNLEAALAPLGETVIPAGEAVDGAADALAATTLAVGGAVGDALSRSAALSRIMVLDEYQRPYRLDLSGLAAARPAVRDIAGWLGAGTPPLMVHGAGPAGGRVSLIEQARDERLADDPAGPAGRRAAAFTADLGGSSVTIARGLAAGHRFGISAEEHLGTGRLIAGDAIESPWLSLAGDGSSIVLDGIDAGPASLRFGIAEGDGRTAHDGREANRRTAWQAELTAPLGAGRAGVSVGGLTEYGSILDTTGSAGFETDGSRVDTRFVGLHATMPVAGVDLFGSWSFGLTEGTRIGDGLVRSVSDLRSETWTLGVSASGVLAPGDRMTAAVTRPLRVAAGDALLDVPVARTLDGQVVRESERVSLAPSGEQLDLQLGWRLPLTGRSELEAGALLSLEPGHVEGADPELAAGLKWRKRL
ncbi:S8 family peptidase [Arenibaculum sp.]|uniref:S8 family peptidase n=1 Tax=Arenibaculum sp. TaxID=2865862 RepID=UPI002E0D343A|nr:S8 family peptidase [Arenibaculum sp.]